jgi:hypothetical protein
MKIPTENSAIASVMKGDSSAILNEGPIVLRIGKEAAFSITLISSQILDNKYQMPLLLRPLGILTQYPLLSPNLGHFALYKNQWPKESLLLLWTRTYKLYPRKNTSGTSGYVDNLNDDCRMEGTGGPAGIEKDSTDARPAIDIPVYRHIGISGYFHSVLGIRTTPQRWI